MSRTQINGTTQILAGTIPLSALVSGYSIPTSNLAQGSSFLLSTGAVAMAASLNMGSNTIQNVASPVNSTDGANKAYVDLKAGGIGGLHEVSAASNANVSITSAPATLDGATPVSGTSVWFLFGQTTGSQNGPWIWNGTGAALTRPTWWASGSTVNNGQYFIVAAGGASFGDTKYFCTNTGTITVDTTATTFAQDNSGAAYSGSSGISVVGAVISPTYGTTASTVAQGNDSRITGALQTSALGTNVATALAVAVGSAGAFVTNGGTLGTPSGGTLSNCSGLPLSGLSGLGTGVSASLAVATGTAGSVVLNGGALGTPSGGTLTNCTGLPIGSVTGFGTGVAAALAIASGSAGGVPVLATGGVLAAAQFPALSGDATTTAGSLAVTVNNTSGSGFVKYTNFIANETPSGTLNGTNTTFTLANTPATCAGGNSSLALEYNDTSLDVGSGNDFTLSGNTITMLFAPAATDKLRAWYMK